MSLINTFRRHDRALMVSDGVGLGQDAKIATIASKVMMMPMINAVIGLRGNFLVSNLLLSGLAADSGKFGTYDGFRDGLVDHLRATLKVVGTSWRKMQGPDCTDIDVMVAGWSETTGPDSYLLRTMEGTPTPAWEIIDSGNMLMTPSSDAIFAEANKAIGGRDLEDLTDAQLIGIAELQREYIEPYGPRKIPTSWVGGFLQISTVTQREISTRIVHRWPDKIGENIISRGWSEYARSA